MVASKRSVGTQTEVPAAETAVPATPPPASFRLEYLTCEQLKFVCQAKGLQTGGLKSDLVNRLTVASNQ